MPTRLATFWDLVPSARILAAAFRDEPLMGPIIHPRREQYPNDMHLFFLRMLRMAFYSGPDHVHLVAYDDEVGHQSITGYAHWVRKRSAPRKQTFYQRLMSKTMSIYNYLESWVMPNRAADPAKAEILTHLDPLLQQHLVGRREECWYLSLLGVDPNVHKSGQGRQLVSYGLEQARIEGIPAGLVASKPAEGFYRRLGFDVELGGIGEVTGMHNPFVDVEGGLVMFTK
ncbi:hypothetical protein AMS68_007937 [Peltaster fructicola]|uniref:N-acetyltransferase domain-containing protein n=1 Tax=Peltaster fructicola TaxID=286661 RepID=A0A6H0Y734_9PEZI|nr:hypothetical protein AMS68_007937 [Peltaster fructicola]